MEIITFDVLSSTQIYLIDLVKKNQVNSPMCVIAKRQDSGVGSRGNKWLNVKKGLYFSFSIPLNELPNDLRLESISIFFGFIFKENLNALGSKVWLKWPNDLYLGDKKIGGVICNIVNNFVVCGIGLNLEISHSLPSIGAIEDGIILDSTLFLKHYFTSIKLYSWNNIFSLYSLEFNKNYPFSFHHKGKILSLKNAKLQHDGSLQIYNERIYSLR